MCPKCGEYVSEIFVNVATSKEEMAEHIYFCQGDTGEPDESN